MKLKKLINILAIICITIFMPMLSIASETIKGKIVGFNSLTDSVKAPAGIGDSKNDLEPDIVFLITDNSHYLISNMPSEVKKIYISKSVKIIGNINDKHHFIEAEELKVKGRARFNTVWEDKEYKQQQKWVKWRDEQFRRGWTPDDAGG